MAAAAVLLIAGGVFLWMFWNNEYTVAVTVQGRQEETLEYGTEYKEQGAEAVFYGSHFRKKPVAVPVTTEGNVDTSVVGDYEIKYTAAHDEIVTTVSRTIHVVDTKKPEITLIQQAGSFTLPDTAYEEEGFTASDDYDGDLTDRVQRQEKDGTVIYTVTDSSGNTESVTRQIFYDDPVPPEIRLNEGQNITVTLDKEFVDPGYTATDNCDGDISFKVTVSGSVDTSQAGTYALTYTVTDSYENTTAITRQVTVSKPEPNLPPIPENPAGGTVYLTFDDGPGPYTDKLLDVLAKYNVKATFFVVNTEYIDKVARIAQEGHTVACHTATHKYSQVYASDEAYFEDLHTIQNAVEQRTGQKPMLLRFPGGSSNTVSRAYSKGIMTRLAQTVQKQGFHYFDWNVDSFDAGGAGTSNQVYRNVISGISKHDTSVVLQHDIHGFSVDAVERIIQWGQANGYTFLPLTADSPGCHHGINN